MTEEIIIDGVNVAGCSHLDRLYCNLGIMCNGSHCDYKQLERLKQENKELKEYSQRMENQRENYYKEYKQLRSALEEIKNIITQEVVTNNKKLRAILDKINEVLNNENRES